MSAFNFVWSMLLIVVGGVLLDAGGGIGIPVGLFAMAFLWAIDGLCDVIKERRR